MRTNAPFVDMYRAMCSVPGTMRALVPTVFTALGAILITVFGLSGDAGSVFAPMIAQNGSIVVNTEVVLAVDVSASMTPDEQALQREGYVQALSSREFMEARPCALSCLATGLCGRRPEPHEVSARRCLRNGRLRPSVRLGG